MYTIRIVVTFTENITRSSYSFSFRENMISTLFGTSYFILSTVLPRSATRDVVAAASLGDIMRLLFKRFKDVAVFFAQVTIIHVLYYIM